MTSLCPTGYIHHRVHVVRQPQAIPEENEEEPQDYECEGQFFLFFFGSGAFTQSVCLVVVVAHGNAVQSLFRSIFPVGLEIM